MTNQGLTPAARFAVYDAVSGYAQAYDDRDAAKLRAVLSRECRIHVVDGRFAGEVYSGADAIVEWLVDTWPLTPPCLHFTTNTRVWQRGGDVHAASDYVLVIAPDREPPRVASAGHYTDVFIREDGRWLIAERRVSQVP